MPSVARAEGLEAVLAAHRWDDRVTCRCGEEFSTFCYGAECIRHAHATHVAAMVREYLLSAAVVEAHGCVTAPLCDGWPFGLDDAYRTIAAVAWPAERVENRDGWAVTMRGRPDLFERTATRACDRLNAAIAHGRAALTAALDAPAPPDEAVGK